MFITIYVITAIICIIMSPRRRYSFLNSTIHIIIIPTIIISSTNRHGPPDRYFRYGRPLLVEATHARIYTINIVPIVDYDTYIYNIIIVGLAGSDYPSYRIRGTPRGP